MEPSEPIKSPTQFLWVTWSETISVLQMPISPSMTWANLIQQFRDKMAPLMDTIHDLGIFSSLEACPTHPLTPTQAIYQDLELFRVHHLFPGQSFNHPLYVQPLTAPAPSTRDASNDSSKEAKRLFLDQVALKVYHMYEFEIDEDRPRIDHVFSALQPTSAGNPLYKPRSSNLSNLEQVFTEQEWSYLKSIHQQCYPDNSIASPLSKAEANSLPPP
jgi:hypothetical protein